MPGNIKGQGTVAAGREETNVGYGGNYSGFHTGPGD
jgi:hypothetical protein